MYVKFNGFLKGFFSLFDWMVPRTFEEQFEDLDNSMQKLYDKMGWGDYNKLHPISGCNKNLLNDIYGYNFRKIVTKEFHKPLIKDPARSFKNKHTRKKYEK